MKSIKRLGAVFALIGASCATLPLAAQNDADVQRYSSNYFLGSARFNAMGGAFGALGGDLSAAHINPAGLGVFRYSEISFTPAVELNGIDFTMNGATTNEFKDKFVVNNIGFMLANETRDPNWKSVNFGVSYTRLNTFNDYLRTSNDLGYLSSLASDFLREANGQTLGELSNFSAGLAWDTDIIYSDDTLTSNTSYSGRYVDGDILNQTHSAERDGRISETSIIVGTNYNDILHLGASLNFQSVFYQSEVSTTETFISTSLPPPDPELTSYTIQDNLQTEGLGVNLKIGAIMRAGNTFRFGAAIHTPTTFSLSDVYRTQLTARYSAGNPFENSDADGFSDYRIRTPWRFMASAAAVIGTKGILSAQYEYSNFGSGQLLAANRSGSYQDFSGTNAMIAQMFSTSQTFRLGGEFRPTKSLFFRGGFALFENPIPINEVSGTNLDRYQYSAGIGYRLPTWSIDLSYQQARFDEEYKINDSNSTAILSNQLSSIALSLNFRL